MPASLAGSQRRMDRVTHLCNEFTDCVPMAEGIRPALQPASFCVESTLSCDDYPGSRVRESTQSGEKRH